MGKNRIRAVGLFLLLIAVFFSAQSVFCQDDKSVGDFYIDTDNDAPIFIAWHDQEDAVRPYVDVEFYATVLDIDNTSDELTVTLYYSNDSFSDDNRSFPMVFDESPTPNQYTYDYLFSGQPDSTFFHYYYQVYDGNTTLKEDNSGLFYTIQWLKVATGGSPYVDKGDVPEHSSPSYKFNRDVVTFIIIVAVLAVGLFMSLAYNEQRKTQRYYIRGKNKWLDKRIYGGIILVVIIIALLNVSVTNYTVFEFEEGAELEWKITDSGLVNTSEIKFETFWETYKYYERYSLEDDVDYESLKWVEVDKTDILADVSYRLDSDVYREELTPNMVIWIGTAFRSDDVKISRVDVFNEHGFMIYKYQHIPLFEDSYDLFIYQHDLQPFIIGDGIFVRYYGTWDNGDTITNIFLNVHFDILLM